MHSHSTSPATCNDPPACLWGGLGLLEPLAGDGRTENAGCQTAAVRVRHIQLAFHRLARSSYRTLRLAFPPLLLR